MILMIIPVMRCGVFVLFCMIILCMPVDFTGAVMFAMLAMFAMFAMFAMLVMFVMFVMFALVFKQGPFAK